MHQLDAVISLSKYVSMEFYCLVDTGAVATILSRKVWKKLCPEQRKLDPVDLQCNLVDAQGTLLKFNGRADVKLQLGSQQFPVNILVAEGLSVDLILGRDFLKKHQCSVELGERDFLCVNQSGLLIPLGTGNESHQEASIAVIATETSYNPPLSEMETLTKVPAMADKQTWLMESDMSGKCSPVVATRATVTPKDNMLNPRDGPMTQRKKERRMTQGKRKEEYSTCISEKEEDEETEAKSQRKKGGNDHETTLSLVK